MKLNSVGWEVEGARQEDGNWVILMVYTGRGTWWRMREAV